MRIARLAVVVSAALLAAGCGGGGSGGSSSTAPRPGGGTNGGGMPKKATAPNAPAGSKVVACKAGATGVEGLRATAVDCGSARATMLRWGRSDACALGDGESRGSCSLGGFRCQAVRADRGVVVSCARPGGDVSFIRIRRGGG
ncbi:MAG TPA: hypothetical protein VHB53_14160 [Solirubrobacterales bacterium]|nr:hypothetical protein [Solirubrobacterales bacterium]